MQVSNHELPALLNQRQLADFLGKSTAWLERARWAGNSIPYIKIGRNVRYRREDVLAYLDSQVCRPGAEKAEG